MKVAVCKIMQKVFSFNGVHSNFLPLLEKTNNIISVDIILGDVGFDDDSNHVGAKQIGAAAIIPTRYGTVPIWRTSGHS